MPSSVTSRTLLVPRTGTKVAALFGLALLVFAAYWYWVPTTFLGGNGQIFGCGSAANPPTDRFPKSICGELPGVNKSRAIFAALAGVLVAAAGAALFGFDRRHEERELEEDYDDQEDVRDRAPRRTASSRPERRAPRTRDRAREVHDEDDDYEEFDDEDEDEDPRPRKPRARRSR